METYELILNIVNDTLDSRGISSTAISHQLQESRKKIVYWRNGDYVDDDILYRLFEYLHPDLGFRTYLFITEKLKTWKLPELKHLYENISEVNELKDAIQMSGYQWDILCKDILRKIVNLAGKELLKEKSYEKTTHMYQSLV